jgi:hypothetical protein
MYAPTRTNAQTPTNTRSQLYITGGLPRGRGAGGGMLSSLDVFTLLVVEKNGKKRLVVCFGFVAGWCLLSPTFHPVGVGSR